MSDIEVVKIILPFLLSFVVCAAETEIPATKIEPAAAAAEEPAKLAVGSAVTTDVFAKLAWIQGSGPATWEPGKVYLLECWAMWCGPCLAAIPHVNALHKKYEEKGLVVIGINVWDDGKDKVTKFVNDKGADMDYSVAYTGKGGAFETEWLKPAGVTGIPHAFVVKDGEILVMIHPMQLTDEVVEALLAGGDAQQAVLGEIAAKQMVRGEISEIMQRYTKARVGKDVEGIAKSIEELKAVDAGSDYLPLMNFELIFAKKDYVAAEQALLGLPEKSSFMALFGVANSLSTTTDDVPISFVKTVAEKLNAQYKSGGGGAMEHQIVASLFWQAGEKEAALKSAKLAAEKATAAPVQQDRPPLPSAPFVDYAAAMEKGTPPSALEFSRQLHAELQKAAAEKP